MDAPAGRAGAVVARSLLIVGIVFLLRLPFVNQAIQGDDPYYLYGAEHAQVDPLHPHHARYIFQGDLVDMRGFSHPPLNAWMLAALLAVFGGVPEVPFHFGYMLWSVIAALAMWSLAQRFCDKPLMATLLFLAVPAFVVNGNSLESDLPFLAFWMSALALFAGAVDDRSRAKLAWAGAASVLAALAAYQAIFLTPVLAVYLFERRRTWTAAWWVVLGAPLALGVWQIYERSTSAEVPAMVLTGYLQTFEVLANKARNAAALVVHSGWIVSPLLVVAAFFRGSRWRWIAALSVAGAGAFYDLNPLFWASLGCGVLVLTSCFGRGFLGTWVLLFFAGALAVFFAGSARYLLPIAAPVAILIARSSSTRLMAVGFALQMTLSVGLAIVNYQHWDAYRRFAASLSKEIAEKRTWINAEWGLRFYLESAGALPMAKGQLLQPGEILVSSALSLPLDVNAARAPIAQLEIRPAIPLRIISLEGRSAYSSASLHGLLPFEISTAPIDRVLAEMLLDRKPELTFLDPRDPKTKPQVVGGLFEDGWMADEATVVLKRPEQPAPLRALIYIPPNAPARHVRMLLDGRLIAEETFGGPGAYTISAPVGEGAPMVTVTLTVDKTFSAPGDRRKLGIVVTRVGFQ